MLNSQDYNKLKEKYENAYSEISEYCVRLINAICQCGISLNIGTRLSSGYDDMGFETEFEFTGKGIYFYTEKSVYGETQVCDTVFVPTEFVGDDKIPEFIEYLKKQIKEKECQRLIEERQCQEKADKAKREKELAEYERLKKIFEQ